MSDKLSHIDMAGAAHMVDVGAKSLSQRVAIAEAIVRAAPKTIAAIEAGDLPKGDVIGTARLAGIMGAKLTPQLIPLCHPLPISGATVMIDVISRTDIRIEAQVKTVAQTGVEMEALTAATTAALTLYDMAKAVDKAIEIRSVRLLSKSGGKSGDYIAPMRESGDAEC